VTNMLGITVGDSSGVGPEILVRAFLECDLPQPVLAIGDAAAVRKAAELLGVEAPINAVSSVGQAAADVLNVLDQGVLCADDVAPGRLSRESGHAAYCAVETAARLALAGAIQGLVTLPMNKEATRLSHPDFTGHTELIAGICGVSEYAMMLVSDRLIVTHVSTHVPLRAAVDSLRCERIAAVIRLTHGALRRLRPQARIAVAGLNPHAGEGGAFGAEDAERIRPAVAQARAQGLDVHGPVAPDTVFVRAVRGEFDAVVCMYHDQGHIPAKLLAFDSGVNVTLGLPIVRTSVDHGTAFDIAYQGKAGLTSFVRACELATQLVQGEE